LSDQTVDVSVYARRKSRREWNSDYVAVTKFTELTWILTL